MEELRELRAIEQEIEREWRWLIDALNVVARARADHADAQAFRLMQQQAMAVGQRRVEVGLRIAALVGPPDCAIAKHGLEDDRRIDPAPRRN